MFRGPRDPEIAAGQTCRFQAADECTQSGAIHERHVVEIHDEPAMSLRNCQRKLILDLSRCQEVEPAGEMHHSDAVGLRVNRYLHLIGTTSGEQALDFVNQFS